MNKHSNIWYVEAFVLVPAILHVKADNEQEAFARAIDGAWHNVVYDSNKAQVKSVGNFTKGPGITS